MAGSVVNKTDSSFLHEVEITEIVLRRNSPNEDTVMKTGMR